MNFSQNRYFDSSNPVQAAVWYQGTDALLEGEAVCYVVDQGTVADKDNRRNIFVNRPAVATNRAFAGVAARDYSANSTGQLIDINCPGSKGVNVAIGQDVVANTNILTFTVGAVGRFVLPGFEGRGSIIPRRTVTAVRSSSLTGGWTLATDGKTLTAASHGASVGDTLLILGSETNTVAATAGRYNIASVTDSNTVVLSTSAVASLPGGTLKITGTILVGTNPRCQADLLEGPESGGVEFVAPPAAGEAGNDGTEMSYMVGGFTYVCGGMTVATGDPNGPLAEPAVYGLLKGFRGLGTITTKDVRVTLATDGTDGTGAADPTGALNNITIDDADEYVVLVWTGGWSAIGKVSAALG